MSSRCNVYLEVTVPQERVADCLRAVNDMDETKFEDLGEALAHHDYVATTQENGDVFIHGKLGDSLRDYGELFEAVLPFATEDSLVEVECEGEMWKWCMKGKNFRTLSGKIIYEDEQGYEGP